GDDVFYRFSIDSQTEIIIDLCGSRTEHYLYLLDNAGNLVASGINNAGGCYWPSIKKIIPEGTYYIVVDGSSYSYSYQLNVMGIKMAERGRERSDAILIGNYSDKGKTYSFFDSRNNDVQYGYGNMIGQPSDDIYYKLILGNSASVSASLCGSD